MQITYAMTVLLFFECIEPQYQDIVEMRIGKKVCQGGERSPAVEPNLLPRQGHYEEEPLMNERSILDPDTGEQDVGLRMNRIEIDGSEGLGV